MQQGLVDDDRHMVARGRVDCALEVVVHGHRRVRPDIAPSRTGQAVEYVARGSGGRVVGDYNLDVRERLRGQALQTERE